MKHYKYHYVYRITNTVTDMHYYGSRSCNCHPVEDLGIKYFSHSSIKEFIIEQKLYPNNFKYKLIKVFKTNRGEATALEVKIHKKLDVKTHAKFYNKSNQTSSSFDRTGVKDNKSLVVVYDALKQMNCSITLDEFNTRDTDRFTSPNKGMVAAIDTRTNLIVKISSVELKNNNFYKSLRKGLVSAIDIRTNKIVVVSTKEYQESEFFKNVNSKKINIFDNNGCLMYSSFGNFIEICTQHDLPRVSLQDSYLKNKKLYETTQAYNAVKQKFKKYRGWYDVIAV